MGKPSKAQRPDRRLRKRRHGRVSRRLSPARESERLTILAILIAVVVFIVTAVAYLRASSHPH